MDIKKTGPSQPIQNSPESKVDGTQAKKTLTFFDKVFSKKGGDSSTSFTQSPPKDLTSIKLTKHHLNDGPHEGPTYSENNASNSTPRNFLSGLKTLLSGIKNISTNIFTKISISVGSLFKGKAPEESSHVGTQDVKAQPSTKIVPPKGNILEEEINYQAGIAILENQISQLREKEQDIKAQGLDLGAKIKEAKAKKDTLVEKKLTSELKELMRNFRIYGKEISNRHNQVKAYQKKLNPHGDRMDNLFKKFI